MNKPDAAESLAVELHPHMSISLAAMIHEDMRIYAGQCAAIALSFKTVGDVKSYLNTLVAAGKATKTLRDRDEQEARTMPVKSAKKKVRR